jgi:hypothetical protein
MGQLSFSFSQVIAGAALVASVVSLVMSWRAGHRAAKITTYRSATDLTIDIDHVFVEHPELRKYFYDGEDLSHASEETRAEAEAIAELMLDCFECIWDLRKNYSKEDRFSWGRYILDMLSESPVMEGMYTRRKAQDWYPALEELEKEDKDGSLQVGRTPVLSRVRRLWRPAGRHALATRPEPEE